MSIVIYLVHRIHDHKSYVGQATLFKSKNGIPYRYGSRGRISDHISSESTLGSDITKYGRDAFEITDLCICDSELADEMEARYIDIHNALAPDGYNIQQHSLCKHRSGTSIIEMYLPYIRCVDIKGIRRNGQNKLVRIYLYLNDGKNVRINIGSEMEIFEESYKRSLEILKPILDTGIPVKYDPSIVGNDDPMAKYMDKLERYDDIVITKVRVTLHKTKWDQITVVFISTPDTKSWKDEEKICFGGKTIPTEDAIEIALEFVNRLDVQGEVTISPEIRSRQQAAAA